MTEQTTRDQRYRAWRRAVFGDDETAPSVDDRDYWFQRYEREAADAKRLRAEVAALRLTLGGRTFDATVPEPIGCPCPGACSTVAEIGRLRVALRVNGLRYGATDAEIDEVIYGKR